MKKNYLKKLLVTVVVLSFAFNTTNAQTVSTFAGSGVAGFADGTGSAAQFKAPKGIVIDAAGNIYVADLENHRIRKITPLGVATTIAGSGVAGLMNGNGTAAQFNNPHGLVLDANGNIFVTDYDNNCIRKITPAGDVTTFAGAATYGNTDGVGVNARFRNPDGIVIDNTGNLFVADNNNHKIRKIAPDGTVTTFSGTGSAGDEDGDATSAQFNYPNSIAIDAANNLYVTSSNKVKKITPTGTVSTFVGSGNFAYLDGIGTAASLKVPTGLVFQNSTGNLYFSDSSRIRMITSSGTVSTFAGQDLNGASDGGLSIATFNTNDGLAFDANNNLFVCDSGNNKIRKITTALASSNFDLNNKLTVYPNPTTGILNIDLKDLKTTSVELYDLNGCLLTSQKTETINSALNISDLSTGIYLLKVATENGSITKRIVKE